MSFNWHKRLKKLHLYFEIGIIVSLACAPGAPVTPTPTLSSTETPIPTPNFGTSPATMTTPSSQAELVTTEILLGMAPLEEADQIVWTADRGRLKKLHHLERIDLNTYLRDLDRETTLNFYESTESTLIVSIPSYRNWSEIALTMNEHLGFSQLTFDREIWSDGQLYRGSSTPKLGSFFIGMDELDEQQLSERLLSLGYDQLEYRDITYLSNSREGYWVDPSLTPSLEYGQMNRVHLDNDRLIAASSTERLTDILDLQLSNTPTLLDSIPHSALSRQLGNDVIATAFIPLGLVLEMQRGERGGSAGGEQYGGFFYEKYKEWSDLHEFSQSAIAFVSDGMVDQLMVALYYSEPNAANADREEVERRLSEYYLDTPRGSGSLSVICGSIYSETAVLDGGSVLTTKCIAKEPPELYKESFRLRFVWPSIVKEEDLLFLLPNPEEYPAPDCGGKFNPIPNRPDIPATILFKVFCEGNPECIRKFEANLNKDIPVDALFQAVCRP